MLQVICRPEATNKEEAYTFHTVHRKRVSNLLKNMYPEARQCEISLERIGINAARCSVALKSDVSLIFETSKKQNRPMCNNS